VTSVWPVWLKSADASHVWCPNRPNTSFSQIIFYFIDAVYMVSASKQWMCTVQLRHGLL